jgi:hypothetical protein
VVTKLSSLTSSLLRRQNDRSNVRNLRSLVPSPPFLYSSSSYPSRRVLLEPEPQPRTLSLHMLSPSIDTEEEWHPHDPAWTTPQLLEGIWSQIAQAKNMVRNVRNMYLHIYYPHSPFITFSLDCAHHALLLASSFFCTNTTT